MSERPRKWRPLIWDWLHGCAPNKSTHYHPCPQMGSVLGLMLCSSCLIIFNNFIFELVFCKWSPQNSGAWHEQGRYMQYSCPPFFAAPFMFELPDAHEQNPSGSTMRGLPMTAESGGGWKSPQRPAFYLNTNLL